ncbi:pre-mrna-processing factor 17 [Limosa lapponica baueri]|uniref:Pre-mrna-processing factor 17 n=1 Tax=Limosa lapponica baueri TaxID=1758121 RepID=A0A2I0TDY0_LIMLA|nr:pre-mrna-processing factor 17 [Limosa lapponica baueri]
MSLKPSLGSDEEIVESLWGRIKGQAKMRDTVVVVYYRPPDQDGEADEAFYSQLKVASQSQALVLVGDFNHPDICWKGYTARHVQSRRFLQCIDDNFSTQVVEEPTRRGVLLDLVLTNKEGLVKDMKAGGSLGYIDHEKIEFRIVGSMHKARSRTETLDFRRANLDLFKKLLGEIPWDHLLDLCQKDPLLDLCRKDHLVDMCRRYVGRNIPWMCIIRVLLLRRRCVGRTLSWICIVRVLLLHLCCIRRALYWICIDTVLEGPSPESSSDVLFMH